MPWPGSSAVVSSHSGSAQPRADIAARTAAREIFLVAVFGGIGHHRRAAHRHRADGMPGAYRRIAPCGGSRDRTPWKVRDRAIHRLSHEPGQASHVRCRRIQHCGQFRRGARSRNQPPGRAYRPAAGRSSGARAAATAGHVINPILCFPCHNGYFAGWPAQRPARPAHLFPGAPPYACQAEAAAPPAGGDLPRPAARRLHLRRCRRRRRVSRRPRRQPPVLLAVPAGRAGQHARIRRGRSQPAECRARRRREARPAGAAAGRGGPRPGARHRSQPHGAGRAGQRLVVGRAGERAVEHAMRAISTSTGIRRRQSWPPPC